MGLFLELPILTAVLDVMYLYAVLNGVGVR